MESFAIISVLLTFSTALAAALLEYTVIDTQKTISLVLNKNKDELAMAYSPEGNLEGINSSVVDSCPEVYLFKEWTSSTGLLFSVLLLYIGLVTITNAVVAYKFITTWNQITVSLREQNRVCAKYAKFPSTRRQTCQEALKPSRYMCEECNMSTQCPICLLDLQSQEFVVTCDGGCGTKFHQTCIYKWLEFKESSDSLTIDSNTSCPCCRKEMIGFVATDPCTTTSGNGFISELSTLVGYYPIN